MASFRFSFSVSTWSVISKLFAISIFLSYCSTPMSSLPVRMHLHLIELILWEELSITTLNFPVSQHDLFLECLHHQSCWPFKLSEVQAPLSLFLLIILNLCLDLFSSLLVILGLAQIRHSLVHIRSLLPEESEMLRHCLLFWLLNWIHYFSFDLGSEFLQEDLIHQILPTSVSGLKIPMRAR